jgi:integrase
MHEFLSAVVLRGMDPAALRSLADVVAVDAVKTGLRFFLDRASGSKSKQAYHVARMLTAIARHWVKVDRLHLDQLRAICQALNSRKPATMTAKNRDRLRQFENPANLDSILLLPTQTLARYRSRKNPTRSEALEVQSAVGLEVLLMIPLRSQNFAQLHLDDNILRTRARRQEVVHVYIPADKVKNELPIEAELPTDSVKLLDLYLEHFRPILTAKPSRYLFPNSKGGHKAQNTLAAQITKFIWRKCGIRINLHLFRHFAATHYLADNPGDYGTMKGVLNHTSVDTTTRNYCGTETAAAVRHFDRHVLRLRERAFTAANLQGREQSARDKKPRGKVAR